ncbi:thiamine ABC transporter substrate-binding protein [Fervidicella metallireducens AeB]|uniref:Thiamine ABC transporter substrate-binding protein n=1 Tax=Fervidicella metallireducens AeB TaxID=1403537 RepID=A0A017S090_9CLOT|nr:ABC-F family ATP-binding cassette domain-containing protein [Fervidicella metallireducens]EYE89565.1 thiamine ABC transporter substrate-binding protein [Fervidicella metallireducens AeB]
MYVLSLNKVSKSYGTDIILKDITFSINENEKVGLVGKNGAGKTTLFKILCGLLTPDTGDIFIAKEKRIGYLSQNLDLEDELTIFQETMKVYSHVKSLEARLRELEILMSTPEMLENEAEHNRLLKEYGHVQDEFERLNGYGCESFAKGVLVGLGIRPEDFNKEIKYLSGGQKTRVALSKLLLSNPEILLLDEPTNHLDLDAIYFLEGFLKDYKGTVILISHDRYFLDVITTKTLELTQGMIEEYNGNYTYFINERDKRYEQKLKEYELQQKEIERLEEIIERYRSFNREKSIKQAESKEKQLAKIERIDKPAVDTKAARINFEVKFKSGNDVLIAENLSKAFGENLLFENLSFMIRREEKVALIGENGKGKSTIFKIICGNLSPDSGLVKLGKNVYIGYYDQEQKDLSLNKTVLDELWDAYPDMTVTEIRNYLAAFLFTGDDVFKTIDKLSGGERARLSLLKLMLSKSNFLLLDEPTNHLDILSREALEKALSGYEGTLFVISHDRYFLNKVINRILELDENGLTEYLGNFQYYLDKKNASDDEIVINTTGKTKTEIKEERKKLRESQERKKQIQRDIKNIEKEIEETENEIKYLEEQMCLEEVYSNPEKSLEINKKILASKEKLEKLLERWEELIVLEE